MTVGYLAKAAMSVWNLFEREVVDSRWLITTEQLYVIQLRSGVGNESLELGRPFEVELDG